MSFVLEALKKQEAGNDPDAAVSLARQSSERHRYRLWVGLFSVAMVINVAVLAWVFGLPLLRPAEPPTPVAGPPAASRPTVPGTGTPARPDAASVADTTAAPVAAPAAAPMAAPATGPAPAVPQRTPAPYSVAIELRNLPADARQRFPGLAFSTHIYAEDSDLRAIVANGERLREGDRVRGLEILSITETGVVLGFERYRVTVPIVTDW